MNETNHTEWIEQYLLGQLAGESLTAFQTRMQQEEFRQEVALQQKLVQHIQYAGEEELRRKMNSWHDALPATPSPVTTQSGTRWMYVSLAASVALLLGLTFWFYQSRLSRALPPAAPVLAYVPLHTTAPESGPSADVADSIRQMAVLLYPDTLSHYLFDDTLRLYGKWDTTHMELWYDALRSRYVLQLDTFRYELQRYVDTRLKP